jgi:hypothetical protein
MGTEIGQLEIRDSSDTVTRITLDGETADISAGGEQKDGDLSLRDAADSSVRVHIGRDVVKIVGVKPVGKPVPAWGLWIKAADGTHVVQLVPDGNLVLGGKGSDGDLSLTDEAGKVRIRAGGAEHRITIRDTSGTVKIQMDAETGIGIKQLDASNIGGSALRAEHSGLGVYGVSDQDGVRGDGTTGVLGIGSIGVQGDGEWIGVNGNGYIGVYATGGFGTDKGGIGVYAQCSEGKAGEFIGDVQVSGEFSCPDKQFRIDHPLDSANKYLVHCSVESSERLNVYSGKVTLDGRGEAWVELPAWWEAINDDFRYQLTAVGGPAPNLHVAQEVSSNRFKIAGGTPGTTVSWQVVGTRRDAYARAHPLRIEVEKPEAERGTFLHPVELGFTEEARLNYSKMRALTERIESIRRGRSRPGSASR